uniref:uncharacterized protein C2orf42 homolog isoform X3 n=1 Tax=Myxine glutinosa TaxID=7769 RepID=UPI00358E3373
MDATACPSALLCGLGRPTLRGLKRCPNCGTKNGCRGLRCKNERCGLVFRLGVRQRESGAVHLLVGGDGDGDGDGDLFSVRGRDCGPEQRGFVLLPKEDASVDDQFLDPLTSGHCYLSSCQGRSGVVPCHHVQQAVACRVWSTPLSVNEAALDALQVPGDIRQEMWLLEGETMAPPLVQRVSRACMVVRCTPNAQNAFGYLHCTFNHKGRSRSFHCACASGGSPPSPSPSGSEPVRLCAHFYYCICAFASDLKLEQEFGDFIKMAFEPPSLLQPKSVGTSDVSCVSVEKIETDDDKGLLKRGPGLPVISCPSFGKIEIEDHEGLLLQKSVRWLDFSSTPVRKIRTQDGGGTPEGTAVFEDEKPTKRHTPVSVSSKRQGSSFLMLVGFLLYVSALFSDDESKVNLSFRDWLSSVTERIYEMMHYQLSGKPEPLIFHIPQAFFEALQNRMSFGSKKKRLPNSTTDFVTKNGVSMGTFSKYTWLISSIHQVKQIFSTPECECPQEWIKLWRSLAAGGVWNWKPVGGGSGG